MNREHLLVTIARTYNEAERLSQIDFHDADLNALRDDLFNFAFAIHNLPQTTLDTGNKEIIANDAEKITHFIHCLMNSLGVTINAEMEYVVRRLATNWNIDMTKNVLVFAKGDYAVCHLGYDQLGVIVLESRWKVKFTKEPRFVYLPQFYDGDMLFNAILFHEVGHMVERDNAIADVVYPKIADIIKDKPTGKIANNYFKALVDKKRLTEKDIKEHIKEYVSDVFGCQYLGKHILEYASYRESAGRNVDRLDHPTYACRERIVNSMMNYMQSKTQTTADTFLEMIINAFKGTPTIGNLCQRCIAHPQDPIYNGTPIPLSSDDELFSVFTVAWEVALGGKLKMEQMRGEPAGSLSISNYYKQINETVKMSIQNYMSSH